MPGPRAWSPLERDRRAAHSFALSFGLRRTVEPDLADTAFSPRFVEEALEISRPQAGLAIKGLIALRVMEMTGEDEPIGKRKYGTRYYGPAVAPG